MDKPMSRLYTLAALALAFCVSPALAAGVLSSDGGNTPNRIASRINQPVPAALMKKLAKASKDGLSLAPQANQSLYLKTINGPRVNKGNKVGVLYIGADFCPYCAGQRWALVLALMRFGHFKGLQYMASSPDDVYANTPTFSFQNAVYTSRYINFVPVETADRNGNKLQSLSKPQNQIFSTFDAPPHMPQYGGIPFVYLDGQYVVTRPMVRPSMLTNMDWTQAAEKLGNEESSLFQASMPQINALTAALCRLDGGNPDDVCSAPGVTGANAMLFRMATQNSQGQ